MIGSLLVIMMDDKTAIGDWLEEIERVNGLNSHKVAERIGVTHPTISYLKSRGGYASWKVLLKMRKAFGLNLNMIADRDLSKNGES